MASDKVLHLTDDTIDAAIAEGSPLLIDFWATWCGPCRRIAPIIEELAAEYEGRVRIAKVDVDNNQQAALKFGIQSIPTLLMFKGGQLVDQISGAVPKDMLAATINRQL